MSARCVRFAIAGVAHGIALAACAPVGNGVDGGPVSVSRQEERVRIGSYSQLRDVAVSRRYVFAAGGAGIAIYDRQLERWLPPLTREGGFTDTQITVLAGDPVEDALWYGVPGAIVMYRPFTEQLQRTPVVGIPDLIAFDRATVAGGLSGPPGIVVRSSGQRTRVSRIGLATPLAGAPSAAAVVVPPRLPEIYAQYPTLRISPDQLLRDAALRRDAALSSVPLRVTSGAVSPERSSDLWLGTDGDGLFRVDGTFLQGKALPFGLREPGVGALAPAADGVWIGGLGDRREFGGAPPRDARGGVTFATSDLQRWRWIEGTIGVPLAGRYTTSLAARGTRLWLGTDRGLVRVRTDSVSALAQWGQLAGLPDDRVLSLAPRESGAWVGTARGLAWASDSGARPRAWSMPAVGRTPIAALQVTGDSLWVATPNGLLLMSSRPPRDTADASGADAPGADAPTPRGAPIRLDAQALAASDSVLLIATDRELWQLVLRDGQPPVRLDALDVRAIAPLTQVAIDARTIVVAGRGGVLLQSRRTGATRLVPVAGDLLSTPTAVLLTRDWLWIGTAFDLVRWHRTGDGLPP